MTRADFKVQTKDVGPFTPKIGLVLDDEGLESVEDKDEIKQRIQRHLLGQRGDAPPGGRRRAYMPWVRHPWNDRFSIMGQGGDPFDFQRLRISIMQALTRTQVPEVLAIRSMPVQWKDAANRQVEVGPIDLLLWDRTPLTLDTFTLIAEGTNG